MMQMGRLGVDVHHLAYDFPAALQHYQEALKIAEDMGYRLLQVEALVGLAKFNQDLGDMTGAHTYALQALRYALESDYGLHLVQAHLILGQLALAEGDYASTQRYLCELHQNKIARLYLKLMDERKKLEKDLTMVLSAN